MISAMTANVRETAFDGWDFNPSAWGVNGRLLGRWNLHRSLTRMNAPSFYESKKYARKSAFQQTRWLLLKIADGLDVRLSKVLEDQDC